MRQLGGASGAALLVPGTVVAALVVLALGGGFGGLGAVGQVFTGPSVPSVPRLTGNPSSRLVRATLAAFITAAAPHATHSSAGAARRHPVGARSPSTGVSPGPGARPPAASGVPPQRGGLVGSSPPPQPVAPTPRPTVVDKVVGIGTSVTNKIPGPGGALATQTIQSVGGTVDRILKPPSPNGGSLSEGPAPLSDLFVP
jgi:hypothetical protein